MKHSRPSLNSQSVADHNHQHGDSCGHVAVKHGDHVDYEHDGHLHRIHGNHVDECDGRPYPDKSGPELKEQN